MKPVNVDESGLDSCVPRNDFIFENYLKGRSSHDHTISKDTYHSHTLSNQTNAATVGGSISSCHFARTEAGAGSQGLVHGRGSTIAKNQ